METISWQAPEHEHHAKDDALFWISISVAILFFAAGIFMKRYLFSGFVIIAEALVIILADREPKMVEAMINDHEIRVDHKVIPLKEIRGWSFVGEPHRKHSHILLHPKAKFSSETAIIVPDEMKEKIVGRLQEILPEEEHEESLLDLLSHYLKF